MAEKLVGSTEWPDDVRRAIGELHRLCGEHQISCLLVLSQAKAEGVHRIFGACSTDKVKAQLLLKQAQKIVQKQATESEPAN